VDVRTEAEVVAEEEEAEVLGDFPAEDNEILPPIEVVQVSPRVTLCRQRLKATSKTRMVY
jgi:hypothetical protein